MDLEQLLEKCGDDFETLTLTSGSRLKERRYTQKMNSYDAPFPHCDSLVLHAPGECMYCDHYKKEQSERIAHGINFTGHHDAFKKTCPSELRRPLERINKWPGNVARKE